MSGEDIETKAIEIKEKLLAKNNLSSTEREQLQKFKATTGFIKTFNNRHNIRFKNFSGEVGSVDENVVDSWFNRQEHLINKYDPSAIGNLDETGINFNSSSFFIKKFIKSL